MRIRLTCGVGSAAAAVLVGAGGQVATAQVSPQTTRVVDQALRELEQQYRLAIPQDQPIEQRLFLDAGGSFRAAYFSVDDERSRSRGLRQFDTRVYVRAELDGAHRFYGRLKFEYDDFNSGQSFDGKGDDWNDPFLDRLWYEFDYRGLIQAQTGERTDYNFNIHGGKDYYNWGSGLVLSNVLYGGTVEVEWHDLALIGLGGITSPMETVDFDSSRPNFDDHTDRIFGGGMFEYRGMTDHRPYLFFMAMVDANDPEQFNIGGVAPTIYPYDAYYIGAGSRGGLGPALRYRTEFVFQFGTSHSNSFDPVGGTALPQTEEDIEAFAGILGFTYLLRDDADTRFDFELLAGSGDDDRFTSNTTFGGNQSGTKDTAFNSIGYVNTGLALAPRISNLLSLHVGASTSPFSRTGGFFKGMRVGVDGFLFTKIDDQAPISLATIPGEGFIGGEIDLFMDWRIMSDLLFSVRYGAFFPGDAMPAGQDDIRQFFYVGMTYAF